MSAWSPRLLIPTFVLAAAGAFMVHAQQTANVTTINACVGASGILRVVSTDEACRPGETAVSWGSGLVGYEIATRDFLFPPGALSSAGSVLVDCPAGKKVMGGGAGAIIDFGGSIVVGHSGALNFDTGSFPFDEDSWSVGFDWPGGGTVLGIRAFATCAY